MIGGRIPKNKNWTLLGRSQICRTSRGKATSTSPLHASSTMLKSLAIVLIKSRVSAHGFRALYSFRRKRELASLPTHPHFVAVTNLAA